MSIVSPQPTTQPADTVPRLLGLAASELWRSSAPAEVRNAWKQGDTQAGWNAWSEHLASRKTPASLAHLVEGKSSPLSWGTDAELAPYCDWLSNFEKRCSSKRSTDKSLDQELATWLRDGSTCEPTPRFALECLAWAHALPKLAACVEPSTWWGLIDTLLAIAEEASGSAAVDTEAPHQVLVQQLLGGELALTLSWLVPELRPAKELRSAARATLSDAIIELTDGEGMLTAELLGIAPALLACWTRSLAIGQAFPRGAWSGDAQTQFEWLVQQVLRLVDAAGTFPFAKGPTTAIQPLLHTLLQLAGNDSDRTAAAKRLKAYRITSQNDYAPPEPSSESEWATVATLAAGWSDKSPRMTVVFPNQSMRIEIRTGGQVLLSGDWPIDVRRDGKQVTPTGDWDSSCWHSDEDCDYLELSIPLSDGSKLERLFLLGREHGVAMLAEILLGDEKGQCRLHSKWTLPAGVQTEAEDETRDASLIVNGKRFAGLIPLALPEWRIDKQVGELSASDTDLTLSAEAEGKNLASPLWIDFSPKRFARQRTWRQLAVAESLENVANDVAVGYRVQSGKEQWLLYRSLEAPANRTLIGQNTAAEALYGQLLKTDEVDEYLEIEADDS